MNKNYIAGGLAAVIIAIVAVIVATLAGSGSPGIVDFATCTAAGYPVQEVYPARCVTKNGASFTETLRKTDSSLVPNY
jgi:hypothetical protein